MRFSVKPIEQYLPHFNNNGLNNFSCEVSVYKRMIIKNAVDPGDHGFPILLTLEILRAGQNAEEILNELIQFESIAVRRRHTRKIYQLTGVKINY